MSTKNGKLRPSKFKHFVVDVLSGMNDRELAEKYGLRERTANNWRHRALRFAEENPHLVGG
ncbi:MAG TPA: hypothetical protein VGL56_17400 [Fimbriimonadaceae bacterium]